MPAGRGVSRPPSAATGRTVGWRCRPPVQTADVVVRELTADKTPAGSIGTAFYIHAENMTTEPGAYARIFLRYDSSILGTANAASLRIGRRADTAFQLLAPAELRGHGDPPNTRRACVNRDPADQADRSHDQNGDAVMVIHALDTSRWVAR